MCVLSLSLVNFSQCTNNVHLLFISDNSTEKYAMITISKEMQIKITELVAEGQQNPVECKIIRQSRYYLLTYTHLTALFSGTTQVSWYQKGKTSLDFTEARDSEWQWHQLGHMQVCTSLQTDNHARNPPLSFLQAGCPSCHPTNSVKALKAKALKAEPVLMLLLSVTALLFSTSAFSGAGWMPGNASITQNYHCVFSVKEVTTTLMASNQSEFKRGKRWSFGMQWHEVNHMQTICT